MRTREKPPRNTYEKTKKSKSVSEKIQNIRHAESDMSKKHRRHAEDGRQRHIRRIWLKCTLSAAVFTLTLTAAAGWQVLKARISSWQEFSAKATTLILSDAQTDKKLQQQDSKISSDPGNAVHAKDSLNSDDALRTEDFSDPDDAVHAGDSSDSNGAFRARGSSDSDAALHRRDSSDSNMLPDSAVPSDSFAEPDFFEIVDADILKREQLEDTTADTESVDHIASVSNDWNLILVNPWNPLPDNYDITLAPLPNGHFIDQRCYNELMEMLEDCRNAGLSPLICSSYRTQEKQETLFQERIDELTAQGYSQKEARIKAATSVARPGTSEHQAGLAVDLVDSSYQFLNSSQEYTQVQQWLMENSWKYGFILRYPSDKSSFTGIIYEPWHYRYVGKTAAEEIYKRGICLEEYLAEQFE